MAGHLLGLLEPSVILQVNCYPGCPPGLSLLSNAVLVWNTIKIGNIVGQLRTAGEQIDDADLSRVSPLAHRHVIPNGTYFHNQAVGDPKE